MISNVGFQGNINTSTNARPYMNMEYQYAAANTQQSDTVEIAAKKPRNIPKKVLAAVGTALVAAASLFGLVKTGKLNAVKNPTKFTEKLQNLAFKGGTAIQNGVNWVATKANTLVDKAKNMFYKK